MRSKNTKAAKLLMQERRRLMRWHKQAVRMNELGYSLEQIAKKLKLTEDDIVELLKEKPC